MNPQKRRAIFQRFQKQNPDPTTELLYKTPFELLVAVILSAQMTDKGVNLATPRLFAIADTPKKMLALGEEKLKDYINKINLYHSKARHLIQMSELLIRHHNSEVPRTREELEKLPGVGRKTANVILNTVFGETVIAVDTHIFRVANRTRLAPGQTPLAVEKNLLKCVPPEYLKNAHHWLLLHGRYICIARKPKCPECMINDLCEFNEKTV
jgi:endonuclease III